MNQNLPKVILLFSGKRKSGKDFISDKLFSLLNSNNVAMIKISGPIKDHWAKEKGLQLKELLGSGELKETYRIEMIHWSDKIRLTDYGYFCSAAIEMYSASAKPVWIVSDIRRKTDIRWFKENYNKAVVTIRISANDEVRKRRGWRFTQGVDDGASECDLDDYTGWDKEFVNNGSESIEKFLAELLEQTDISSYLS